VGEGGAGGRWEIPWVQDLVSAKLSAPVVGIDGSELTCFVH
jgi:hypothetical protein